MRFDGRRQSASTNRSASPAAAAAPRFRPSGPASLPLQDDGPRRAGDLRCPVRAARIRDEQLVWPDGLAAERFEKGRQILRFVPGRHDAKYLPALFEILVTQGDAV